MEGAESHETKARLEAIKHMSWQGENCTTTLHSQATRRGLVSALIIGELPDAHLICIHHMARTQPAEPPPMMR